MAAADRGATDRGAAPGATVPAPARTAGPPGAGQATPADPARVAPGTARLTVAAAQQATGQATASRQAASQTTAAQQATGQATASRQAASQTTAAQQATGQTTAAQQATGRTTQSVPDAQPLVPARATPARAPNPTTVAAGPPPETAPDGSRRREFLAHLNLTQVVCWQVAVLAVALAVRQPVPVLVCVAVGAAVLVALTTVRIGGRWLYEHGALAVGYLSRTRRRDLPEDAGKTPALLDLLIPNCAVQAVETGHGLAMTASHRGGLTAVMQPHDGGTGLVDRLPTPAALVPLVDGQQRALGVQTVYHAGVRRDVPAKVWLAVHATRGVDVPGDDELALVLRNAMRRMRRMLGRAGVPTEPLAEEAAFAMLAGLAHVTGGRNQVREDWRFWRTGPVCQAAFELRGWHRLADSQARRLVGELLTALTGVAVTVTLAARSGDGGPRVGAVLRIAATSETAIETALATTVVRATACGVRPARLDGTQSRGVAASLPIGVFLT
ncbi:hypothetical protein AAH979_13570 [Plantactinospora sp. ZYX-F-223]|uniref:hypothetical protein n=1 Tax=Plantactinospora sp. ZYX-F-223 TaxID=3144103 RepID=UPI0031FCFDBE